MMPISSPSSTTGNCETSALRMRLNAVSSVSSGATVTVARPRPSRDQVAQVAVCVAQQALLEHPLVVEHLGQVLRAAVADERDHALGLGLLATEAKRRGEQCARRRAAEDAFLRRSSRAAAKLSSSGIEYAS